MKVFSRIVTMAAIASAAVVSHAPTVRAQPLPSATDVIAKYVTAIGGKEAILQIKSMSTSGTLSVPAMGLTAEMQVSMAAPNKYASKTNIPGMGEMVNGYNGTVAWDVNPMAGPRLLVDKELEQIQEGSDFYANLLFSADRYSKMEVQAVTDFGGEKAYKLLTARKGSGAESTQYFSVATGLLLGSESTQVTQMGAMQVSQSVGDYKQFGPIKVPTKVEQTMGPNKMIVTTKDVTFNGVPDNAFDVPAQVKPLIKP